MRGDNHLLALTVTVDEITGDVKPLFAFPIQVCKATDDGTSPWVNVCPSGAPTDGVLRLDPITGEAFTAADTRKGVFVGDDFREISKDDIADIEEATKIKTMVAMGTVPLAEAWMKYGIRVQGSYFIQSPAKGGSPKAYRLTYEALLPVVKGSKVVRPAMAVVTKRTASTRQAMGFVYADADLGCLVMVKLCFAAQVRQPDEMVKAPLLAVVEEPQIEMARQVVDQMPDGGQMLDAEVDDAVALRAELVEQALAGDGVTVPPKAVAEVVENDDVTAALLASISG